MPKIKILETEHLILREWKVEDLKPYAELTSNSEVMKFFPKTLTKEESDSAVNKFQTLLQKRGWGFWAIEEKKSGQFIGYAGLHSPSTTFPFSPCVEIAWRVSDEHWENGYVLELGKIILDYALNVIKLDEVVYFSSVHNQKASKIVEKLGMINQNQNFHHPFVEKNHSLSLHYLYKIKRTLK